MTKDQLILLLKKYKENKARYKLKLREKERILKQLEEIREVKVKSSATQINGDIRSKNSISDKVGNYASENTDREKNLKQELEALEKEIEELKGMIEDIDIRLEVLNKLEKLILIEYYVEDNTYQDVADKFKRSLRNIQDIVKRATNKVVNI